MIALLSGSDFPHLSCNRQVCYVQNKALAKSVFCGVVRLRSLRWAERHVRELLNL